MQGQEGESLRGEAGPQGPEGPRGMHCNRILLASVILSVVVPTKFVYSGTSHRGHTPNMYTYV